MRKEGLTYKQRRGIAIRRKMASEYLADSPMIVALYYSGTVMHNVKIAKMLNPDLSDKSLETAGHAIGDAARTILEPQTYAKALKTRRRMPRGIIKDDIPFEKRQENGRASIAATGTELMVFSHGQIPYTAEELKRALELREDPLYLDPKGKVRRAKIAEMLNTQFHIDKPLELKRRTGEAIGQIFKRIDQGKPVGVHKPPQKQKYIERLKTKK